MKVFSHVLSHLVRLRTLIEHGRHSLISTSIPFAYQYTHTTTGCYTLCVIHCALPFTGKQKAYQLATIDAEGLTVTDIFKKQWKIGQPVGTGGFGRLYQVKCLFI